MQTGNRTALSDFSVLTVRLNEHKNSGQFPDFPAFAAPLDGEVGERGCIRPVLGLQLSGLS